MVPRMLNQHLHWLSSIPSDFRHSVGDKAFYLSLASQQGYPIVPGFVVSAEVFSEFLEQIHWNDPFLIDFPKSSLYIDVDQPKQLQSIARQIQRAITTAPFPLEWANLLQETSHLLQTTHLICRPSISVTAPHNPDLSFKIRGLLTPQSCRAENEAIAHAIQQVWADVFCARSLFVWQRAGIPLQALRLGVLIQPLYPALASGTLRSCGDRIETTACWGLGIAIKTGDVVPDHYVMDADTGTVCAQHLGQKPYAYGVTGQSSTDIWDSTPLGKAQGEIPPCSPSISRYAVTLNHHHAAVLPADTLKALTQLSTSLSKELNTSMSMEWVIGQKPILSPVSSNATPYPTTLLDNQQAWLYLAQLLPHPLAVQTQLASAHRAAATSRLPLASPHHSAPTPSTSTAPPESSRAMPLMTALGAAPGQVIAPVWVVDDTPQQSIAHLPSGYVLVAADVTPDWLLDIKRAGALVSERGGMTCHAAIVARELGIPAVVGASEITQHLRTGDQVLINGDRGTIHRITSSARDASAQTTRPSQAASAGAVPETPSQQSSAPSHPQARPPTRTHSPTRTQLMVSMSQEERLHTLRNLPIDGIGLLRGELLLPSVLNRQSLDTLMRSGQERVLIDHFVDRLRPFLEAVYPSPVYYRSADLRAHEFAALLGHAHGLGDRDYATDSMLLDMEPNPLLGNHGTLSYVQNPILFQLELNVLHQLRLEGYEQLHLILPFVRTVEEFVACRQRMLEANLLQFPGFQVWIMAEVPSVLFLLPEYVKAGVSGIAIGTNDLTQLMLAVDRNHPSLSAAFDQRHPAVMRAIEQLVKTAQQLGIPCSICGEAPSQYPELVRQFVKWGVTSISVTASSVEAIHGAIAQVESALYRSGSN
ncbi:MAG: putative PEP-binding protein [Cyanobacteria bacterium P01_A01_bin.37]